MSISDTAAGGPAGLQTKPGAHTAAAVTVALFATLLIGGECVAVAGAISWAIASSLEVSGTGLVLFEGIALAGSLVVSALFARKAFLAERKFRLNPNL